MLREKLVDILLKKKLIGKKDLDKALEIQKSKGGSLSKILVEEGFVEQKGLMMFFSEELNIPPVRLSRYKLDPDVAKIIPERIARKYSVIPISRLGESIVVATADPLNILALDDIKALTGCNIDMVVGTAKEIDDAIASTYRQGDLNSISDILEGEKEEDVELVVREEKVDVAAIAEESKQAPIVKLVNQIICDALKKRASDIHLEPRREALRVRYRIDGDLHDVLTIPKSSQNAILARLKIMSNLNITEFRLPQDGRFKVDMEGREIDFRVSLLPITHGNKVVLRALDKSNLSVGLDSLGFLPGPLEAFKEAVKKPYGMILVTGPTGSGKSTTLYSIINQLNVVGRNIITIEDPVEYQLPGITQVQVNPQIGLTFASGLRSILRQNPDIIMIGEIRDFETADIAIKASLTGQLVLSTLHTNDAPSAVTRLIDMGVEPFLVASSLILIAAQRLARRLCDYCKEGYMPQDEIIKRFALPKDGKFCRGKGCNRCNNTGYMGRLGTLETLVIDEEVRRMVTSGSSSDDIKDYASAHGMKSLRENALKKFIKGDTSLEEVLRVT
ncbi:MAG: hypothetical protein AUJ75_02080 [Candidatus Omnitrophica bacterium CG1_02_49_10]|nr:MAG: hypothetical protein AUJ75_02080 [Candidatus Omnitrophica bacterium CG1_02_49_10]